MENTKTSLCKECGYVLISKNGNLESLLETRETLVNVLSEIEAKIEWMMHNEGTLDEDHKSYNSNNTLCSKKRGYSCVSYGTYVSPKFSPVVSPMRGKRVGKKAAATVEIELREKNK